MLFSTKKPVVAAAAEQPAPVQVHRYSTLVVDDDDFVAKSMPSFLSRFKNVEVIGTAKDGLDALEKIKSYPPEVVLMDVRMPKMDGIEATKHIVRDYPNIRVILMSGYDDDGMREECKAVGAHAFMSKLHVTQEFPALINEIFGRAA
jgi:two-component system chemotaxis response regulator CheB